MNQTDLNNNIILIGYRGTGKSTIGHALKQRLDCNLFSTDELIVKEFSMPIPEIIEQFGWERFRDVESKVIKALCNKKSSVIDCGGGVVENEENMKVLKQSGKVVLLTATIDDIIIRTQADKNRPSLKKELTLREEIKNMLKKRDSMYNKYADFVVNTSKINIETVEGINEARDEITDFLGENNECAKKSAYSPVGENPT